MHSVVPTLTHILMHSEILMRLPLEGTRTAAEDIARMNRDPVGLLLGLDLLYQIDAQFLESLRELVNSSI